MEKEKNNLSGHRARMRTRFLSQGMESLSAQEAIEMLLYYAIPQKDTAVLAQELLDTFGSLQGIMTANREELKSVPGMTAGAVNMLSFLRAFDQRCLLDEARGACFRTMDDAVRIFRGIVCRERSNQLWIAFLDAELCVREITLISDLAEEAVSVDAAKVADIAERNGVTMVMLLHYHGSGSAEPSAHDVEWMRSAVYCLKQISVYVLDHLIVTDSSAYSMRAHGFFFDIQSM